MLKSAKLLGVGTAAAIALVVFALPARAATKAGTLTVTATVSANCNISDGTLAFGSFDLDAGTTGSTTFTVACTTDSPYSVAMDSGENGSGTGSSIVRKMSDGATPTPNLLSYQLYTDSGDTDVWEDACSTPTDPPPSDTKCVYGVGSGTSSPDTLTVYGKIASGQNVPAAAYTDHVTMTVTF